MHKFYKNKAEHLVQENVGFLGNVDVDDPSKINSIDSIEDVDVFKFGGEIKDKDETYSKWKSLVNMSGSELEKFYNSKEGKVAGLSASEAKNQGIDSGRESARWIMKMKGKSKDDWDSNMWRWAKKQISFISRMKGMNGKMYDDKGRKTRKHTSLLIWGHNPEKYSSGGDLPIGKLARGMNLSDIAHKHGVSLHDLKSEFVQGVEMEKEEHTDNYEYARAIALDHLFEDPKYYTKLKQMENSFMKDGGEVNPDNNSVKNSVLHNSGSSGGMLVGNRHSEGGIKAINKSNNQPIEMEGGEVVITRNAVSDDKKREFEGEMLTNRQILSRINSSGGGVSFEDGGDVPHACSCSGKEYKYGGKVMKDYHIVNYINGDNKTKRSVLENYYNSIKEDSSFANGGFIDGVESFSDCAKSFLSKMKASGKSFMDCSISKKHNISELENANLLYFTTSKSPNCVTAFLTKKGKRFISMNHEDIFKHGGETDCGCGCGSYEDGGELNEGSLSYFKGVEYEYENQFVVNKAIEELLQQRDSKGLSIEEKNFLTYYSGYGGLQKFGASGKGLLYEYFTPSVIAKKMWALAYKHGFQGGYVLEPSCGIGEFIKYAPEQEFVEAYEINEWSAKISSILYPSAKIVKEPFEKIFIKNNYTIKGNTKGMNKYSLVIGNPPYGSMAGLYAGMGEKDYTKANNYIDYFISRGLDLLKSGGLLIYIIGTEVAAGGKPFLQQGVTENKKMIAEKAELIDAYRLPNGVFERTDVLTDIVVFRKK